METNPKNSDSQIINYVSDDSGIAKSQVQKTISLFEEGATIPFIARYRKEVTGGLDETQLRTIQTQHRYYQDSFEQFLPQQSIDFDCILLTAMSHTP